MAQRQGKAAPESRFGQGSAELGPRPDHGAGPPRGLARVPQSSIDRGRYGRMFRHLPAFAPEDEALWELADTMGPYPAPRASGTGGGAEPGRALEPGDNPDLPAGYTYLGQYVVHDITFDSASSLERRNDPDALRSYRTPRFDLDSLYGSGPADSPYLYDQEDPVKLLVGVNTGDDLEPEDLPRNQQGRALVGDARNDVHVIISQLQLAFIRFHNSVVDHLREQGVQTDELFAEAQRLTRWHYQWVVVEDYLRGLVGSDELDRVLVSDESGRRTASLRFFHWRQEPFIPVEFSAAAFRFGHSQIRARYQLNRDLEPIHILLPTPDPDPLEHLGGFRPLPNGWSIDWHLFFEVDGSSPQPSRRIDTKLTGPFIRLPPFLDEQGRSLAFLDLLRGKALGLPTGESVAAAMGTSVPSDRLGLSARTPLWYYLLREAEVLTDGRRLGSTCAGIVAEVLVGLLAADPSSYLRADPGWTPELPGSEEGRFTIVDLLRFAGVVSTT